MRRLQNSPIRLGRMISTYLEKVGEQATTKKRIGKMTEREEGKGKH